MFPSLYPKDISLPFNLFFFRLGEFGLSIIEIKSSIYHYPIRTFVSTFTPNSFIESELILKLIILKILFQYKSPKHYNILNNLNILQGQYDLIYTIPHIFTVIVKVINKYNVVEHHKE